MDEIFIECVRNYPCLWDTKLPSYKQLDVKDAAWKEILKKTNIESVTLAKLKWKNLRDTHREKLKRINKTKSGQAQKNIKPWKYMSHMEFLLPYMTNTERDTNAPAPHPDISTSLEGTADTDISRDSTDSIRATKRKMDETIRNDEENILNFLKTMEDNRGKRTAQRDELRKEVLASGDPLKAFFDSMYHSTKQMPEFYQRSIKRKLFQLVMDAEENIANTNYSYSGYYSNDYAYNSRPSTNQTNYSSGHASAYSPEPSGSGLQQIGENTTRSRNEETQDSMPAVEITPRIGENTTRSRNEETQESMPAVEITPIDGLDLFRLD